MKMGYGLAVIYVGQQTWGRVPGAPHYEFRRVRQRIQVFVGRGSARRAAWRTITRTVRVRASQPSDEATCSADFVSAARGTAEGNDAILRALQEGFPTGTAIFLDIERMEIMPPVMREYYKEWTKTLVRDGRYRPAYYVHHDNARLIHSDVMGVLAAEGVTTEPQFWVAKGRGWDVTKLPSEVGHAFADVWQGILDTKQRHAGIVIPIDVNVSGSPNPSGAPPAAGITRPAR